VGEEISHSSQKPFSQQFTNFIYCTPHEILRYGN
jgi:hypothetical protein